MTLRRDLTTCVLVVLVLVWFHEEARTLRNELSEVKMTLQNMHEELQTFKTKAESTILHEEVKTLRNTLFEIKTTLQGMHEELQTLKTKTESTTDILNDLRMEHLDLKKSFFLNFEGITETIRKKMNGCQRGCI